MDTWRLSPMDERRRENDFSFLPREAGKGDHPKIAPASEGWWKGPQR
jgi:hypothetical protein